MTTHTVQQKDFANFFPRVRLCGHHNPHTNKVIDMLVDPIKQEVWYEFIFHKEVLYVGFDFDKAIELYNNH